MVRIRYSYVATTIVVCYATAGIVSNVTLNGEALRGWRHTPIDVGRACGSAAAATLPASNSLHTNEAPASGQLLPAPTTADEHSFLLRCKPAAPSPPRAEWPPTSSSFTPTFYSGNYTLTGGLRLLAPRESRSESLIGSALS